jgi:hypothetical protein
MGNAQKAKAGGQSGMDAASPIDSVRKLSEVVTQAIERLFNLGGLALVLIFIGAMTMVAGVTKNLMPVFWAGFGLLFVALLTATVVGAAKRREVREKLRDNREIVDRLQLIALRATDVSLHLQSLLLVNAESVANTLVAAKPVLKLFGAESFANQENLRGNIITALESARDLVNKVKAAIEASDPRPLQGYADELGKLNELVLVALRAPQPSLEGIKAELSANLQRLQQGVAEFCDSLDSVTSRSQSYVALIGSVGSNPVAAPFLARLGLVDAVSEAGRMEKILSLANGASRALGRTARGGSVGDLSDALQTVRELRTLVGAKPGGALPAQ